MRKLLRNLGGGGGGGSLEQLRDKVLDADNTWYVLIEYDGSKI